MISPLEAKMRRRDRWLERFLPVSFVVLLLGEFALILWKVDIARDKRQTASASVLWDQTTTQAETVRRNALQLTCGQE